MLLLLVRAYFNFFNLSQTLKIDLDRSSYIFPSAKDLEGPLVGASGSNLSVDVNRAIEERIEGYLRESESSSVIRGFRSSSRVKFDLVLTNRLKLRTNQSEGRSASTTPFALKCTPSKGSPITVQPNGSEKLVESLERGNILYRFEDFSCRINESSRISKNFPRGTQFELVGDIGILLLLSRRSYYEIFVLSYIFFAIPAAFGYIKLLDGGGETLSNLIIWSWQKLKRIRHRI